MTHEIKWLRVFLGVFLAVGLLAAADTDDAATSLLFAKQEQGEKKFDPDDAKVPPDARPMELLRAEILASGDYRIDSLVSGYQWGLGTVTYSFYEDDVFHGSYYSSETVSEVSEGVKANVRQIMAFYGTLFNINFVEVTETSSNIGLIRFMRSSGPGYAYAYYPSSSSMFHVAGDVHLNPSYDRLGDTNGFQHPPGQHGYVSLIHEIGHTLGLKHPHDGSPTLPKGEDNQTTTVMTYDFTGYSPATPMGYDLMALQYLYGGRTNRSGNDLYPFTSRGLDQYSLGALYWDTPYSTQQVIWDSGGINNLDLTGLPSASAGYRLDLRELGWLCAQANYIVDSSPSDPDVYMRKGSVVGKGVAIRDVTNSFSSDSIYANPQPNVFKGYDRTRVTGNDVLYYADAADTLDLSGYTPSEVTDTQDGNDRVLGFGANGSVRIKDYYLGNGPVVTYSSVPPSFSVNDVTLTEGNSGTVSAVFTVSLSQPSSDPLTVDYATSGGTATEGSDYGAASGVLTFAPNETSQTVNVTVYGDTAVEPNETFYVNLANPSAPALISDSQGTGTINNDDVAQLAITAMTPQSYTPPYGRGQTVTITATVKSGDSPAAGASVVFKMTKPGTTKTTKKNVTANSSGVAVWNYTIGRRDPLGNYSVSATATLGSQTAASSTPAFFSVQ